MNRARRFRIPLVLGVAVAATWYLRYAMVLDAPLLPVAFEHSDHMHTECVYCHHNWVDDTGSGSCYFCHKVDLDVAYEIETMFHDFCRDCHTEVATAGDDAGPTRRCGGCHI